MYPTVAPARRRLAVGAAYVLGVLGPVVAFSELRNPDVWFAVGAVYALTLALVVAGWYLRPRSLGFPAAVGVAGVVVLALAPLTPRLFVVGNAPAPLLPGWSGVALHLQRFVPVAFMLPLGVATSRRRRVGVVAVVVLPVVYELVEWFVVHPERFSPYWTTPLTLVVGQGFWLLFLAGLGGPLFLLGRRLARREGGSPPGDRGVRTAPDPA